jgi:hypothetical protein
VSKPSAGDVAEVLLAIGAAWLAFRGHSPTEVAARATKVVHGVRRMRERLEDLGEQHVRQVVGCQLPARCACLFCEAKAQERPS